MYVFQLKPLCHSDITVIIIAIILNIKTLGKNLACQRGTADICSYCAFLHRKLCINGHKRLRARASQKAARPEGISVHANTKVNASFSEFAPLRRRCASRGA